jgi:hypothetical protein
MIPREGGALSAREESALLRTPRSSWTEIALVIAFFTAIAIAATFPLITQAHDALPAGLGDPAFGTFLLAWDADRIAHGFRGFWNAPYLFPHQNTLAYAEHLFGIAIFTAPIQWLTRNPVLVYNVAFLASYVLAGAGMYLLTRSLWGRRDAAVLAGLAFMLSPYRMSQVTHLQVLMAGWMPIALWCLHRYLAAGSRRALAGFAAAFALQALSNGYFLFFFSIALVVVFGVELVRPRLLRARIVRDMAVAGLGVVVVLAPFAWMYISVQRQNAFDRNAGDLLQYGARLSDYFKVFPGAWTWGGLLGFGAAERQLFPGFVVMALAAVAIVTARQPDPSAGSDPRGAWTRMVTAYTLVALVALWVSMGPGPWRPYDLLFRLVPGFSGMRVPARMATIVDMALAVLAAAGAARLLARIPKRLALAATAALSAVVLLEGRQSASIDPFPPVQRKLDRAAYEWLRDSPPGAAVELRIVQQNDFHPFTLFYQFNTLLHRHPIVNGYTGWPSSLQEFLGGPASPFREPGRVADTLMALRTIGVRYVLLHWWTYADGVEPGMVMSEMRAAGDQIVEERQFQSTVAWRLAAAPPRSAPRDPPLVRLDSALFTPKASHVPERLAFAFDGDVETRWLTGTRQTGNEWLELRLKQPADIGRVRIETSPRGLLDYPRRLVVESVDEQGGAIVLFEGSVLTRLIESMSVDDHRAPVDIELPPNRTSILRLRQTGETRRWFWSVHELSLWRRQ